MYSTYALALALALALAHARVCPGDGVVIVKADVDEAEVRS